MNQVALITGGSRGIGRGIALALARAGFNILINYRRNERAAQEAAQLCRDANPAGARVEIFRADMANRQDRIALLEFCKDQFKRIDLLVNNAGIAPTKRKDMLEASEESFDELITTNVKGPFFLTQQIANWMIELQKSPPPDHAPRIVTISSISAYTASVNRADYCISKAALSMLTPLFASRLAEHGIAVFEIRPGIISTEMTAGVKEKYDALIANGLTPLPRWGTPADVANAVLAIVENRFPFSTGEVFNVDGGFHMRRL